MRQNRVYAYAGIVLWGLLGSGAPPRSRPTLRMQLRGSAPAAGPAEADQELQTIVVTGLRESLGKSLEIKRMPTSCLDSINAPRLGRFPDDDVADSLAAHHRRHPSPHHRAARGIRQHAGPRRSNTTSSRSTTGFWRPTTTGASWPSTCCRPTVISGADVFKSSQASAMEGSIGGTVNMRSASPFDNPGCMRGAHVEGNYNDMSLYAGKKGSAFISNTFDDDLGILDRRCHLRHQDAHRLAELQHLRRR